MEQKEEIVQKVPQTASGNEGSSGKIKGNKKNIEAEKIATLLNYIVVSIRQMFLELQQHRSSVNVQGTYILFLKTVIREHLK